MNKVQNITNIWDEELPKVAYFYKTLKLNVEYKVLIEDINHPETESYVFRNMTKENYVYNVTFLEDYLDIAVHKNVPLIFAFPKQSFRVALARLLRFFVSIRTEFENHKDDIFNVEAVFVKRPGNILTISSLKIVEHIKMEEQRELEDETTN